MEGFTGVATTTTTGPNDVRHVVWALGEFFFHFLRVFFFVFNDLHRYYRLSKGTVWFNTSNDDDNGPKRRETRRLGQSLSSLPSKDTPVSSNS